METIAPHWTSLLPPVVAIGLALISRQVVFSLVMGVFTGALISCGLNPLAAFMALVDKFVLPALADRDHAAIIIFSMMLGGMVGIISKSGGAMGIVAKVERMAKSARMGQLSAWVMGLVIFFDDYANTLIVGNTMRPITDRFRISREKLAYIVDSTAAPVAGLFLSTWIGYEIGVIGGAMKGTGFTDDAFSVFVMSIPYRFYAILAVAFVAMVAITGRDFGAMLDAERRAAATGDLVAKGSEPAADLTELTKVMPGERVKPRWINGALPIAVVVGVTILGLWHTGQAALEAAGQPITIRDVLSNASSTSALFWGSLAGCVIGVVLSIGQRLLSLHQAMDAWFAGVKSMLLAIVILVLAWSIGAVTKELGTAEYVVGALGGTLPAWALPALTFVIAAFISFATGTSWGTMAILMPIVVPLAWAMSVKAGLDMQAAHGALYIVVSAVLAGAIWGDHCSPISDTTVMSSMASACDHIDHVRTQMPYALVVGFISVTAGYLPAGLGLAPWASIAISAVLMLLVLFALGRRIKYRGQACKLQV